MKNKKLIEKFIKDNINIRNFDIIWKTDWLVELTDLNGETLTLCTFNPEEVWTSINGVSYLNYKLSVHRPTGTLVWEVISNA